MNDKKFEMPEVKVIMFENEDIVTSSGLELPEVANYSGFDEDGDPVYNY